MKQIAALCLFILSISLTAQNFEDSWTGHFSYISIKDISQGNDRMYVASENAVFTYDLSTQEIVTISTIQGLSGEQISTIHYSENFGLLIIGYENGLIEIVINGEENILSVVDIIDKPSIPPDRKRINNFYEYEGNLYISAGFGISVYDLGALEFGDSFFIGDFGAQINITQVTVLEPHIYASSLGGGLRRAEVANPDLIDFAEWTTINTGNFKGVQTLGPEIYAIRATNNVVRYTPTTGFTNVENFTTNVTDFQAHNGILTITATSSIQAYTEGYVQTAQVTSIPDIELDLLSGLSFNNNFFLGTADSGMLVVPFGGGTAQQLLPDGPILNSPFAIDATPGQLWVAFGDVNVTFDPFPLDRRGISQFKDDVWTNIPFDEIGFDATNLVNVTVNPSNPNEVYMSSFQKGLLEIQEQTPVQLYNETNGLVLPPDEPAAEIRLFGADFDRQGNLWFTQSRTNNGLIRRAPGGGFQATDISSIIEGANELALTELKISREGFIFFGTAQSGLIGYDPNTGNFNRVSQDPGNGNLPTVNVRALAFDNSNRLWIGTLEGLRVLFNVGGFFEEGANIETQEIIILDNGVPQELLFGQSITDIEVDGSNNKWLATATSGVFLVSSNGQETLQRFTKDNSPLPSNNVQDVAIDDITGTVYFATLNGLVAFNGNSTAPRDDLENVYSFPNPVRPGFAGNVTIDGLTARANVKITDITGNLVFETTSQGGSVQWDTTAFGRYKVASGVYLVLVTTEDAIETTVTKIMIVR